MSVEWGSPRDGKAPAAQAAAPPSPWDQVADAFPAWTLEPPFTVQPRAKPSS